VKTQFELFPNLPTVRNPSNFWARYRAYLKSVKWKEVSAATKALANYECEYFGPTCEWQDNLECHHRNYSNVFRETPASTPCVSVEAATYTSMPIPSFGRITITIRRGNMRGNAEAALAAVLVFALACVGGHHVGLAPKRRAAT